MYLEDYLGPGSFLMGTDEDGEGNEYYSIKIGSPTLTNSSYGRMSDLNIPDDKAEMLLVGLLNCIFELSKDRFNDHEYRIVGTSISPGRLSIPNADGDEILFDTFDMNFLIRLPSSSGSMPDPDDLYLS